MDSQGHDRGRLKKKVEEGGKPTKGKKMKAYVKYTERKPTAMTSKSMNKATISSDEESGKSPVPQGKRTLVP